MKFFFKTVFLIAVVVLLVIVGTNNPSTVSLSLGPIMRKTIKQPAAIMYVGFFAVGFLAGTILMAGGGKKGGSGSAPKPAKSSK